MALLLITHDLGVVRELCERAVVLYAGRVVEEAPVTDLLRVAAPSVHGRARAPASRRSRRAGARLPQIPGTPPDPAALPAGLRVRASLPGRDRSVRHGRAAAHRRWSRGVALPAIRAVELANGTLDISWEGAT